MFKQTLQIAMITIAGCCLFPQPIINAGNQPLSQVSEDEKTVFIGPLELSWGGFTIGSEEFAETHSGDYLNYYVTDYSGAMWIAHFGGYGQLSIGDSEGGHIYNVEDGTISYKIDDEKLDKLQSGGIYMNGVGFTIQKVTVSCGMNDPDEPEDYDSSIIWSGDEEINWGGVAYVDKHKFKDIKEGQILCIKVSDYESPDDDASWIAHFGGWEGLSIGSTDMEFTFDSEKSCIDIPLTAKMVEGLKNDGFFVNGMGFHVREIRILDGATTGIGVISTITADKTVTVYNLYGAIVKKNVTLDSALEGLVSGIYIIGGRKVVIK